MEHWDLDYYQAGLHAVCCYICTLISEKDVGMGLCMFTLFTFTLSLPCLHTFFFLSYFFVTEIYHKNKNVTTTPKLESNGLLGRSQHVIKSCMC